MISVEGDGRKILTQLDEHGEKIKAIVTRNCVPFQGRGNGERGSIRKNKKTFAGISNIGSINRGIRHLVGALSVSNNNNNSSLHVAVPRIQDIDTTTEDEHSEEG